MNDRRRSEDEFFQINTLNRIFGNIIPLPRNGNRKEFLLCGEICDKEAYKQKCSILEELGQDILIPSKPSDLDCKCNDNGWLFPMTLKFQKVDGGSQNLSYLDVITTMQQAPKTNSSDKTCLVVYVGGNYYIKKRRSFSDSFRYDELPERFTIYDFLLIKAKQFNVKCKILCDNNLPKDKASLYDICVKGNYE